MLTPVEYYPEHTLGVRQYLPVIICVVYFITEVRVITIDVMLA